MQEVLISETEKMDAKALHKVLTEAPDAVRIDLIARIDQARIISQLLKEASSKTA